MFACFPFPQQAIFKLGSISRCCGWFNRWLWPTASVAWEEGHNVCPRGLCRLVTLQVLQWWESCQSPGLRLELNLVQEHGVSFSLDHVYSNPRQSPSCICCGSARDKRCHHRLSLNMGKQKVSVSQLFCPPGSHRYQRSTSPRGALFILDASI